MSTVSLRVPEDELKIFKSYAQHNNKTLSEIIRTTLLERIEEEYDLQVFADYEAEKAAGTLKTHPISELWDEIENAFKYDDKVLVEEMIVGREMEVAVLGNHNPKASCVGEILSAGEFYDYDAKYNNPESQTRVVDDIPMSKQKEIRNSAVEIFKVMDCRGLSRVDFFYTEDGRVVFNEINTLPGFTNISMYPQLWEAMGIDQPTLLDSLIKLAIEEHTYDEKY